MGNRQGQQQDSSLVTRHSSLISYFGLTGGVASGKTTVARMLTELGARIIDADQLGHELIRAPFPAYQEIVRCFGSQILDSAAEIDRKRLGVIVFGDPEKLRQLNAIVHPQIISRVEELAAQYQAEHHQAVIVVDAALIYEAGIGGHFRKMLVAWCAPEQQIERLMERPGVSREEAERRIRVQMPVEEKRRRADYVIDCSGSKENTHAQVEAVYAELQRLVEQEDKPGNWKLETGN